MCKLKFSILTLGCKVNYYDSNIVKKILEENNFDYVDFDDDVADIYIINTCSVTNLSDRKSRQMLNKARKKNPNAIILAMGCYSQVNSKQILELKLADIVIGSDDKKNILELIKKYIAQKDLDFKIKDVRKKKIFDDNYNYEIKNFNADERVRAFIKIQDGCDYFCSYCIIPFTRGKSRSRDLNNIYFEVQKICDAGFKEIVLTGINVSAYGNDFENKIGLADVIEKLGEIKNLARIRLSSIEPNIINKNFVDRAKKNSKLCPHFHMSLQSGSDKILSAMNRKYDREKYFEAVKLLKNNFKNVCLTTDVIVGFPGENENDFLDTFDFVNKIKFAKVHVFPFSERKNTCAINFKNKVSSEIKKTRVKKLIELSENLEHEYIKSFLGKELNVLIEKKINNSREEKYFGYSDNYLKIFVENKGDLVNKIIKVKLTDINKNYGFGKII